MMTPTMITSVNHILDHIKIFSSTDQSRIHPRLHVLQKGNRATFQCASVGKVYWSFNRTQQLPPHVRVKGTRDENLTISFTSTSNEGIYDCASVTEEGWLFFGQSELVVGGKFIFSIMLHMLAKRHSLKIS